MKKPLIVIIKSFLVLLLVILFSELKISSNANNGYFKANLKIIKASAKEFYCDQENLKTCEMHIGGAIGYSVGDLSKNYNSKIKKH